MAGASVPGWYGKLPTLGDFASRRLEPGWIEAWDGWLARELAGLRERLGEGWVEGYLASPPWRFVLLPGAHEGIEGAWAGVLMASVDRVGRYFPLTLAMPLAALPASAAALDALLGWLHELEDIGADALLEDWPVERLEHELASLPGPAPASDAAAGTPAAERLAGLPGAGGDAAAPVARAELVELFAAEVARRGQRALGPVSFWLAASEQPPRLAVSPGLPAGDAFAALFGSAPIPAP
ncbi:MAG TPA: type VI secretion system-associated protein TagF [Burkholderiaceae bacterium]